MIHDLWEVFLFNNFTEFLQWAHKDNYGKQGMAAASIHMDKPVLAGDIEDAIMMAKATGNEAGWVCIFEKMMYRKYRITDDLDEELEDEL